MTSKNKNGNNEGSIFYRADRGIWRAQVTLEGRRLSHSGKTKQECQTWLKDTLSQIDTGLTYDSAQIKMKDFLENWLATMKTKLKKSTFYNYETSVGYLVEVFGKMAVKDLRPDQIQRYYEKHTKEGKSLNTLRYTHSVLHGALDHAAKMRVIPYNPADAVIVPNPDNKEMKILNESQANAFLLAVRGGRYEGLYQIALVTGMRQSEILGLKWSDLDWKNKTISVSRQLIRNPKSKAEYFTDVKTSSGRRKIKLGDLTIEKLRDHLNFQIDERKHPVHGKWDNNDLIFPSNVGTPMNQSNLYRNFKENLDKSGANIDENGDKVRIRFHDLRHTAASLMLNHGVPAIIVSNRLGHSKVSITLDIYGHLIQQMQDGPAEMIDQLITPITMGDMAFDISCTQDNRINAQVEPVAPK
jgi:integrase